MDLPDNSVTGATEGVICSIDALGRLSVPLLVLRRMPWWANASRDVLVELSQRGLVRVFGAGNAEAAIENHLASYSDATVEHGVEFEQVVADRYRTLKLYADGRITVTREVAEILCLEPNRSGRLFAQGFDSGIELMSLEFRATRLLDHESFPPIPIGILQSLS